MPVDKQVLLRYQVLNKCFRSRYREYTIEDLLDECNKALRSQDKPEVSKRTIQNDITTLETDYGIRLQENLKRGRQRLYRYYDLDYSLPLIRIDDEERNKIQAAIDVLEDFEGEPLYDWTRSFLMQVESGLLNDSPSPLVTFQSNPDLKGISHFPNLLQAIRTKRVLKLRYTPYGKDTQKNELYYMTAGQKPFLLDASDEPHYPGLFNSSSTAFATVFNGEITVYDMSGQPSGNTDCSLMFLILY